MKDYKDLCEEIIAGVGGKENITNVTHCATRLRFVLKDESKADDQRLKKNDQILSVVKGGGQYMNTSASR